MNVGYDEQNDNAAAAGRQSRWDSSRMTMTNADADTISIKRSESLWTASRSKSQNQQQKSIVDRILGRKDSLGDHEMMEESDPSLPDLLPFSCGGVVNGAPIVAQHEKRHDRRTSLERNFVTKSSASTSSRKGSFVDRYLQKTETSAAIKTLHSLPPIELPMPLAAPEVPSRRRRGSMQRTNVPTGTLIDIESTPLAPIKHERKRRTSGGLKRQQSLTRVHHEPPPPPNDVYESVSDRRRKPSGTLRRQDSMTNLNRLQNEISLLQDTSSSSTSTPYLNPIASNLPSTTNPGRSATYDAMATALLSEPPR